MDWYSPLANDLDLEFILKGSFLFSFEDTIVQVYTWWYNLALFPQLDNIKMDANQRAKIERIQDMFIKGYLQHKHLEFDFNRLLRILLKVHSLRSLDADLIEELFYSKLIGMLQINNVISHILNLGSDYTSEMWSIIIVEITNSIYIQTDG